LINTSPASRSAAGDSSRDYARLPALSRSAAWLEIKDASPADKDVELRHALGAHPLRKSAGLRRAQEMPMKSAFCQLAQKYQLPR